MNNNENQTQSIVFLARYPSGMATITDPIAVIPTSFTTHHECWEWMQEGAEGYRLRKQMEYEIQVDPTSEINRHTSVAWTSTKTLPAPNTY